MQLLQSIQNRIYEVRDKRVMIDRDLAILYETETKALNLAVKRNLKRFPPDFMFQLTQDEWVRLRFQIETSKNLREGELQSQIVTAKRKGEIDTCPMPLPNRGVAMLSSVLHSDKVINMNIAIMRAFVETRKTLLLQTDLKEQFRQIREHLGEHYTQLSLIYDAMENLLDEKASQKKWEDRVRIGFKK